MRQISGVDMTLVEQEFLCDEIKSAVDRKVGKLNFISRL